MKFSLAFASMALAADNQAPVISLDLSAMNCGTCANTGTRLYDHHPVHNVGLRLAPTTTHQRAFSDECEVLANHGSLSITGCPLPQATAMDHHDGPSDVTLTTKYIVTATAQVKSTTWTCPLSDIDAGTCPSNMDGSIRSENVILYTAKDSSDNEAESLTFTMIYIDSVAPVCGVGASSPHCAGFMTSGDISYNNGDLTIELDLDDCTDGRSHLVWAGSSTTFEDAVDGVLTPFNSAMKRNCANGGVISSQGILPGSFFDDFSIATEIDGSMKFTFPYELSSEDFASLFGSGNTNNVIEETGNIYLVDTVKPVIEVLPLPDAECGFSNVVPIDGFVTYSDCYDDFRAAASSVWNKPSVDGSFDEEVHCYNDRGDDATGGSTGLEGYVVGVTYNLSDSFGNAADTVNVNFTCRDTIKPTLYITQLVAEGSEALSNNRNGDIDFCSGGITAAGEGYHAHCTTFNHGDDFTTFHHHASDTLALADGYDPAMNGMYIQHSAGNAAGDYTLPDILATHGTGYSCIDICTATTSSATWTTSCFDTAPGSVFSEDAVGTYYLHYACNDEAGNSITACRTFENIDVTRPWLNVINQSNDISGDYVLEMRHSTDYVDEGAHCNDNLDGDISSGIVISGDYVDLATEGTYLVTYNCNDSAGNEAQTNWRTVVVKDGGCPYCTAPSETEVTIEASFPYSDAESVTCTDTTDGAVAVSVGCSSDGSACFNDEVDVERIGTYVITYSATDTLGNGQGGNNNGGQLCHGNAEDNAADPKPWQYRLKTVVVEDSSFGLGPGGGITLTYKGTVLHAADAFMAESNSSVNGWVIGAVASAVSGVAILGYASTRKTNIATSVPV